MKHQTIPSLTSLRFFAAIAVVAHHGVGQWNFHIPVKLDFAAAGVCFFFVLSGFVLTYNYFDLSVKNISGFYYKRFARIYPTYWFITALFALTCFPHIKGVSNVLGAWWPLILATNLSLLQSWIPLPIFYFSYNAPAWSISCEIFFYLCFPFLLLLLRKKALILVTLSLSFLIGLIVLSLHFPTHPPGIKGYSSWQSTMNGFVQFSPISRIFEFCLGMCVGKTALARLDNKKLNNKFFSLFFEILGTAPLVTYFMFGGLNPILYDLGVSNMCASVVKWIQLSGSCFVISVFLYGVSSQKSFLNSILKHPLFILLGEASFALYLVHMPFQIFLLTHPNLISFLPDGMKVGVYFSGSILLSILTFKFWEVPVKIFALRLMKFTT